MHSFIHSLHSPSSKLFLLLLSVITLSHCNSDKEKTTQPVVMKDLEDPTSAIYTEEQKREIVDKAMTKLKRMELEADEALDKISSNREQHNAQREQLLADRLKLTPEEARANFKGTRFDSIKLDNGDTFNKVTVMEANDIGVTISYEHGARRIKYADLPETIRKRCMYPSESPL